MPTVYNKECQDSFIVGEKVNLHADAGRKVIASEMSHL